MGSGSQPDRFGDPARFLKAARGCHRPLVLGLRVRVLGSVVGVWAGSGVHVTFWVLVSGAKETLPRVKYWCAVPVEDGAAL